MAAPLSRWRRALALALEGWTTERRVVRGIPVLVHNSRPDIDSEQVLARLDGALALIEEHAPHRLRRMRRDFERIWVRRYPCRGAYLPAERTCIVELTFLVNPEFTLAEIAATILHEAAHARLDRAGVAYDRVSAARHERFCRRAELELGDVRPGGDRVVRRALECLAAADEEVAPVIDWTLAHRRVAEADLEALRGPEWLKKAIGRDTEER